MESNSKKMDDLKIYAKNKIIQGILSYELHVIGPSYALDEFYDVFKNDLNMEYPASDIEEIIIGKGETAINILSFQGVVRTHLDREAIIDFIHEKVGEDIWHNAWRLAIWRS